MTPGAEQRAMNRLYERPFFRCAACGRFLGKDDDTLIIAEHEVFWPPCEVKYSSYHRTCWEEMDE